MSEEDAFTASPLPKPLALLLCFAMGLTLASLSWYFRFLAMTAAISSGSIGALVPSFATTSPSVASSIGGQEFSDLKRKLDTTSDKLSTLESLLVERCCCKSASGGSPSSATKQAAPGFEQSRRGRAKTTHGTQKRHTLFVGLFSQAKDAGLCYRVRGVKRWVYLDQRKYFSTLEVKGSHVDFCLGPSTQSPTEDKCHCVDESAKISTPLKFERQCIELDFRKHTWSIYEAPDKQELPGQQPCYGSRKQ